MIPRPRNPSVVFLETNTVLGEVVRHNQTTEKFEPKEFKADEEKYIEKIWDEVSDEKTALIQQIKDYLKNEQANNNSDRGLSSTFDPANFTWDEAMNEINKAVAQYAKKPPGSGIRQNLLSGLLKINRHSDTFQQWLNLLPTGDYGGVIAGAFKMIAIAAQRTNTVRDEMLQAIIDIPEHIDSAQFYVKIYASRPAAKLLQGTRDLYVAIIQSLRWIMKMLTTGRFKKIIKAVSQGESYGSDLEDAVRLVGARAKALRTYASDLSQSVNVDGLKLQMQVVATLRNNLPSVAASRDDVRMVNEDVKKGNEAIEQLQLTADALLNMFNDQIRQAASVLAAAQWQRYNERMIELPPGLPPGQILQILNFDDTSVVNDVLRCRQMISTMSQRAINEAAWVVRSEELTLWLRRSGESSSLVINGWRPQAATERTSFLSFVAAQLSASLSSLDHVITVSHFCGLRDGDGVQGLFLSVIGQIVDQAWKTDQGYICQSIGESDWAKVRAGDPFTACNVLENLVMGLDPTTILVCVIDNITFLESRNLEERTAFNWFLETLQAVVRNSCAIIKALLTTPGHSDMVKTSSTETTHVLDIPGKIVLDSIGVVGVNPGLFGI